jgi:subtilisin family serine protease
LPTRAYFDQATATFTWTPALGDAGTYSGINFRVFDGELADYESITFTVTSAPAEEISRLITTFDQSAAESVKKYVKEKGGRILRNLHIVPGAVVLLPQQARAGLQNIPGVKETEPDGYIHAIDTELLNSWGVDHIGAGNVHLHNKGGGTKLAIIDSGIDYNHPDLNVNYAGGYDFANEDTDPLDDNGHGTHVAGIVAAEDNDMGVVGVAPDTSVYALKVLDGNGVGYWSDFIVALEWAVANGIQVVNTSLGADSDAPGVHEAVKVAHNAGIVLVAAAGNSGNPPGRGNSVMYPAKYEEVIAVAATDQNNIRAKFSSTGDHVELAAPGVDIRSTYSGGLYATMSGTSMASPHVAGVAALIIASGVTDANANGRINDEVRWTLQQTADDLGIDGRDSHYGYGLVDADDVVTTPAGNQAPVANSGLDRNTKTGSTIQLDGTESFDPDGDPIAYSWVFKSRPVGSSASLAGYDTATPTFAADVDGSYEVELTVSDGELSSSDRVVITATIGIEPAIATVSNIQYFTEGGKNRNQHLRIVVVLVDDFGNPVVDVSISIELYLNNILYASPTGITRIDGMVAFKANNIPSGTYTTTVVGVSASGLIWDGISPENTYIK